MTRLDGERKKGRKEGRKKETPRGECQQHSNLASTWSVALVQLLRWYVSILCHGTNDWQSSFFFLLLALTFAFLAALLLLPVFGLPDVGLPPERPDAGLMLNPEVGRKEFPELSCSSTPYKCEGKKEDAS